MSLITYDFDLLVTPIDYPPIIKLSQYDDSRTYVAHLKNDNGSAFQLASGATATFEGVNSKGVAFQIEATVDGDKVSFTPSGAATDQYGKINASICIKSGGEQFTPLIVRMEIQKVGATKEDIERSPGFTDVIDEAVDKYLDDHQPFFTLPEGGEAGQALVSDGNGDAYWGDVQSGGTGLSDDAKAALLACFRNVAWIGSDGQDYYDDLYDALYPPAPPAPPATLLSISAVFNQGGHAVYDTDSLDSLKQYLTVTARYDNGTVQTVTEYTLSGTLAEGTSTITVSYGGKNTTFTVTVTHDEVISGKFTATGVRQSNEYHLCALIVNENIDQGSEIAFEVSGTNWTIDPTVSGKAQFYFGDDSGEVGNGLFNGAGPQGTGYTKTGSNGTYSIVRSCSYSTVMNTPYLKLIIRIGIQSIPFSFDISAIKVTIGGTDRKVIAFGGFFAQETCTIT